MKENKKYSLCKKCKEYGHSLYYYTKYCPRNCDYAINKIEKNRNAFFKKWDEIRKKTCPYCHKKRLSYIGNTILCMNCSKEIKEVA